MAPGGVPKITNRCAGLSRALKSDSAQTKDFFFLWMVYSLWTGKAEGEFGEIPSKEERFLTTMLESPTSSLQDLMLRSKDLEKEKEDSDKFRCVRDLRSQVKGHTAHRLQFLVPKEKNKPWRFLPPMRTLPCRFSRKFGDDSFLTVSVHRRGEMPPETLDLTSWHLGKWEYMFTKFAEKHCKWFYVRQGGNCPSPQEARDWLVDPKTNQEMTIAKYNARMSQAFSTSVCIPRVLEPEKILVVPDILGTDESMGETERCMTDGCGLISRSLMVEVANELQLPSLPSAVQGRLGSFKGLWVMVPDDSSLLEGRDIVSRESQQKFKYPGVPDDEHRQLEVLSYNRENVCRTHAQPLLMMRLLGVPKESLHGIAEDNVNAIQRELLRGCSPQALLQFLKENESGAISESIRRMILSGFPVTHAMVVSSVNRLLSYKTMQANDGKFQISHASYLLMIPDHTQTLEEGQIFVQFTNPKPVQSSATGEQFHILEQRKVILFRAPCQKLSDVQQFEAVDCTALHGYFDCVIFSTKGGFSPASLLSGGDYDGDMAWVVWDDSLCPSFTPYQPTEADQAAACDRDSRVEDSKSGKSSLRDCKLNSATITFKMREYTQEQSRLTTLGIWTTQLSRLLYPFWESGDPTPEDYKSFALCGYYCTKAVDAAKAGHLVKFPKKSTPPPSPSSSQDSQPKGMRLFSMNPNEVPVDWAPDTELSLDDRDCSANIVAKARRYLQDLRKIDLAHKKHKNNKTREVELDQVRRNFCLEFNSLEQIEERLIIAQLCYSRWSGDKPSAPAWMVQRVFLHELCRVKADVCADRMPMSPLTVSSFYYHRGGVPK